MPNDLPPWTAMLKRWVEDRIVQFPSAGERLFIPMVSTDRTEDFMLDVTRSRIDLAKITYAPGFTLIEQETRSNEESPPQPDDDFNAA